MNDAEARSLADFAVSRGTWTREQADAALPPATGAAPAPVDGAAPVPAPGAPTTTATGDPAQESRRALADRMVELGQISREDADFLLASDSMPSASAPADAPAPAAIADPLAAAQLDPLFDRPASADAYRFPPVTSDNITPNELRAMGELAWQARLPLPIAHELAGIADTYASKKMTDAEIDLLTRRTRADLSRRYGDQTQGKIAAADRLVKEVSRANPALSRLLATGAGSDPRIVVHLIEHASRIYGKA